MQSRVNRQDENLGVDVQSSVQRSPLSPVTFEPESAAAAIASQPMDNPKLQLKRSQEYGFNFSNIPLYPSTTNAIQRNVDIEEEKDVATAQMKRDPVQRNAEGEEDEVANLKIDPTVQRNQEEEDEVAQPKLAEAVQRHGDGESPPEVVPDGPRRSFRPEVQESFKASGMNKAASTQMIVHDEAAKSMGALAYTTTQNNQPITVAQSKVANDPNLQIHEGTHSEQQAHLTIKPDSANTLINSSNHYEGEADANVERFKQGKTMSVEGIQLKSQEEMG